MQRRSPRRIGILAGGRSLPLEIAEGLRQRGASVHIVALEGEAESAIERFDPTWVNWGQIGAIIGSFKKHGCRQIAIAGSVRRPDLATIKPDLGFFRALPTVFRLMRVGGDDAILRGVIGYLEKLGLEVVGVDQIAPELVVGPGRFAGPSYEREDLPDIRMGFRLVQALAPFDIGQAVVIANGRVEAIEGAEGTDRMLDRLTSQRHRKMLRREQVARGCLIKAPKPGQELRVDMPVIGPETVRKAAGADLKGIGVLAGKVLAVEREDLAKLAETHRVFVCGFDRADLDADGSGPTAEPPTYTANRIGRIGLSHAHASDAVLGAQVIAAASAARFAGVAVVLKKFAASVGVDLVRQANRQKLFVAVMASEDQSGNGV